MTSRFVHGRGEPRVNCELPTPSETDVIDDEMLLDHTEEDLLEHLDILPEN